MTNEPKFFVVIGASAGGLDALCELVAQIDENIDASFFIVLHLSKKGIGDYLRDKLQKFTKLPCHVGETDDPIERGHIYIARPDHHLILKDGKVMVTRGAKENRWRPSIDILFRSAAAAYCDRVIGIILTGLLDDGTSGMIAIQKCGGTCIVQDPNEAEYPDMPLSVLNNMEVDHCVPLHQMGYIIYDTVNKKQISGKPVPTELTLEAEIAEKVATGIEYANQLGDRTDYSCPECGGGLWEMNEKGFRKYKCHVGHSYTQDDFMKEQSERLESTLWVAMRMMEERRNLLMKFGNEQTRKGLQTIAKDHLERADDLKKHINIIKEVLFATKDD